jgi:predicted amidophosphoribosyltransferase
MNYGIKQQGKFIFCANCGRVISETGEYQSNFCFVCGNPLKIDAINKHEAVLEETKANLITQLTNSAKELETDSLAKVLNNLNK